MWFSPHSFPWSIKRRTERPHERALCTNSLGAWSISGEFLGASVLSLLPFFVLKVEEWEVPQVTAFALQKAPRVTAVHWGLAWMEGGTCRLGGGCSQRGRDRTQPWQTGGEPWAAELWGTFLYWLHLSGWLHSFYSKYLLTTDHVKDTLLGTLRGTGCRKHHSFPAKSF